MNSKPVLFLDFDRTLFDAGQFSAWLPSAPKLRLEAIIKISRRDIAPPDFSIMLFSDTREFLVEARKTHRLVILTFSQHVRLQRLKLKDSGVSALVDDVIITAGSKAKEAENYLNHIGVHGWRNAFIDDTIEHVKEMKHLHPHMRCILMVREGETQAPVVPQKREGDIVVKNLAEALIAIRRA